MIQEKKRRLLIGPDERILQKDRSHWQSRRSRLERSRMGGSRHESARGIRSTRVILNQRISSPRKSVAATVKPCRKSADRFPGDKSFPIRCQATSKTDYLSSAILQDGKSTLQFKNPFGLYYSSLFNYRRHGSAAQNHILSYCIQENSMILMMSYRSRIPRVLSATHLEFRK